ncbi:baseplate wedge protein [Burkholderia phage Maja]|uniref:Baseplate wedge protein n=1 Tax=Burkholderia phage Maja TaxID=2767571 RepID=A0A7S6U3M6_9CAUD|nr:baseplate wedge protein [Burkholderia phage Maja]
MTTATIQTDENNDIFLPDGQNLSIITDAAATVQSARQKCLMRKTEDIYDQNNGVDYFGTIFTPQSDYDAARKSIIDNLMTVPDVLSVESLEIDIQGENFNFEAQIMTIYGLRTIKEEA